MCAHLSAQQIYQLLCTQLHTQHIVCCMFTRVCNRLCSMCVEISLQQLVTVCVQLIAQTLICSDLSATLSGHCTADHWCVQLSAQHVTDVCAAAYTADSSHVCPDQCAMRYFSSDQCAIACFCLSGQCALNVSVLRARLFPCVQISARQGAHQYGVAGLHNGDQSGVQVVRTLAESCEAGHIGLSVAQCGSDLSFASTERCRVQFISARHIHACGTCTHDLHFLICTCLCWQMAHKCTWLHGDVLVLSFCSHDLAAPHSSSLYNIRPSCCCVCVVGLQQHCWSEFAWWFVYYTVK